MQMLAITIAAAALEMAPITQERCKFSVQMFSTLIVTMMAGDVSDLSYGTLDKTPPCELK
jgi:hypothetical protein